MLLEEFAFYKKVDLRRKDRHLLQQDCADLQEHTPLERPRTVFSVTQHQVTKMQHFIELLLYVDVKVFEHSALYKTPG